LRPIPNDSETVNFVRENGIRFSVRSGGHSYAGLGVSEGSLMIDLSEMNMIRVDQNQKRLQAGPGATWGKVYEATIAEELSPPGATVTSVGVAGFTLGGGSGWLSRKYGLALDNLVTVEVVTAEGKILEASESENSDLFWGIRGGAGNFGIVTRLDFRLHPVKLEFFAGQIIYPFDDAENVLKSCREILPDTPEEFMCYPTILRVPPIPAFPAESHGKVVIDLVFAYMGELSDGEAVVQPLRKVGKPILDSTGPLPFMDVQRSFDAGTPKGQRWYSRAHYLNDISDQAIEKILKHTRQMPGAFTFVYFGGEDGAISRVDSSATAFPHRDGAYGFHIHAGWIDSSEDATVMEWARGFSQEMARFSNCGVYVNLLAEDEPDRIKAAYGKNYDKLTGLKRKWDPNNLFRSNQNIPPSA
jgi:FAD/FMN-containing dehydrogenase